MQPLIRNAILFLSVAFLIILSGCTQSPSASRYCQDGTLQDTCSDKKPLFCEGGKLVENNAICGCEKNYFLANGECVSLLDCKDGTKNNSCSETKPLQCIDAELVERASVCGCPATQEPEANNCTEAKTVSQPRQFDYVLRGKTETIQFAVYPGLKKILEGLPRYYVCSPDCPSKPEIQEMFLKHEEQKTQLLKIVEVIKSRAENNDDRARIAISLVQEIPYDINTFLFDKNLAIRYPYEVLFDNAGVCGEKSRLLVFLLRELGFGTAILEFEKENHEAAGIKCPMEFSQYNSGYCFIETTTAAIVTDNTGEYVSRGKLESMPEITVMSDGASFGSVGEEAADAKEYQRLAATAKQNNNTLGQEDYEKLQSLMEKYGMKTTEPNE